MSPCVFGNPMFGTWATWDMGKIWGPGLKIGAAGGTFFGGHGTWERFGGLDSKLAPQAENFLGTWKMGTWGHPWGMGEFGDCLKIGAAGRKFLADMKDENPELSMGHGGFMSHVPMSNTWAHGTWDMGNFWPKRALN